MKRFSIEEVMVLRSGLNQSSKGKVEWILGTKVMKLTALIS